MEYLFLNSMEPIGSQNYCEPFQICPNLDGCMFLSGGGCPSVDITAPWSENIG